MQNKMILSISSQKSIWFGDLLKRLFDIVVSLIMLILFAPFYGLIALAIKYDSPGPVFYRGLRNGRKGMFFKILKFRTMYETEQSHSGPKVTAQDDPRVTPLGHWLRDTKLNEFPQFWNVLRGDMSLVGPRPEDPSLAKTWPVDVANEIFSVRPGITSPASVMYRNEENMLHAKDVLQKYLKELTPDKMRLDQLYVRYRSFWLDLDVIFWTILLLVPKIKAYSPPEQLLYVGPITRFIQRYLMWGVLDFLVAFVSIGATEIFLRTFEPLNFGLQGAIIMSLRFALLFTVINMVFGVNRINWSKATNWNAVRLLFGWFSSTVLTIFVHHYLGYTTLQNITLILEASSIFLFGSMFMRYRSRLLLGFLSRVVYSRMRLQRTRERVLIVGTGRTAEHIAWLLNHPTYSKKFQVMGFVDNDFLAQDLSVYGTKVIGSYKDVPKFIYEYDIGIVLLADSRITLENYRLLKDISSSKLAKLLIVPDVFGALQNLVVTPPFYSESEEITKKNDSPCSYCLGRYSRLEVEYQIDEE